MTGGPGRAKFPSASTFNIQSILGLGMKPAQDRQGSGETDRSSLGTRLCCVPIEVTLALGDWDICDVKLYIFGEVLF